MAALDQILSGKDVATSDDEATPEQREAHHRAFESAVAALEAETKSICKAGQSIAVLTAVRDEFELWEDGQIDGSMPPLATLAGLKAQFQYVLVDKVRWEAASDYRSRIYKIFDSHMGGGTSMSYKLFALFRKGLAAVRAALKSGAHEKALCEAIALTKAMKDNDEWWGDTDVPQEAASIVKALGNLWSDLLTPSSNSTSCETRDNSMLTAWLADVRKEWEGEASEHLGSKMRFVFQAAKPPSTPKKMFNTPGNENVEPVSGIKRKAAAQSGRQAKAARSTASLEATQAVKTEPATEAWLHQLDGELTQRQASAVQLRCEAGSTKRALVVSGAYPLRAVGCAIAESFGHGVGPFDPHPNKCKGPAGLGFTIKQDGKLQVLKPTLKIVQALQRSGDTISVSWDGMQVSVVLDAIKFKTDAGFECIKQRPMPRCVGGDASLKKTLLKQLNRKYLHDRKPIDFLGCSKKEAVASTIDHMCRPISLKQGEALVEGFGLGLGMDKPGSVPGHLLEPLLF
eukprot:gnl/MRDRNA2_/MRDRNA2_36023_c0_seq1.p1 gnl/MRDRNA2_/MRDRNA2_36023_c0~~gnl/MRDRNA2_/MRDRNA2_36023_c0_seq1.p1  ORF type:complete len:539 (-),score=118.34 gnl/MRDRNA2_/MRDRNA2_36023_c0_seq1:443-1984(-)